MRLGPPCLAHKMKKGITPKGKASSEKLLLSPSQVLKKLKELAKEIIKREGTESLVLIGIKRRGDILAQRLATIMEKMTDKKIPVGAICITFYRDDLDLIAEAPVIRGSEIIFPLEGKTVVIVDDVIFTGRTIRAALQEILDYGRPKKIRLAVLVDRGNREVPIQPDYYGIKVKAKKEDIVDILLKEEDGREGVFQRSRP